MAAPVMVSFGWTGENREIKVVQQDDGWHTEHLIDGAPDQQLIRLFGTNVIPTPWAADADRDAVVEDLSVRNPNSTVS
ncbi:MAG: hypothetical protein F4X57_04675 [Chloroflexi bacterium]|nr:hypothetical protein [Chloroflexota bacterium]